MSAIRANRPILLLVIALALAATAGFFTATSFGVGTQQPTFTTTIDVATGPTGLQGPTGPPGPPGGTVCPDGFSEGDLVINHPGGQVTLFTCLKD